MPEYPRILPLFMPLWAVYLTFGYDLLIFEALET